MSNRVLVSFQHGIAALIDRRVLFIHAAVCEELFQTVAHTSSKQMAEDAPEIVESHPKVVASQLKDFPLLLRIVSLADGVEILAPPEVIVKWDNISAICNLSDEQWTTIRKPPRKLRKAKTAKVGADDQRYPHRGAANTNCQSSN